MSQAVWGCHDCCVSVDGADADGSERLPGGESSSEGSEDLVDELLAVRVLLRRNGVPFNAPDHVGGEDVGDPTAAASSAASHARAHGCGVANAGRLRSRTGRRTRPRTTQRHGCAADSVSPANTVETD